MHKIVLYYKNSFYYRNALKMISFEEFIVNKFIIGLHYKLFDYRNSTIYDFTTENPSIIF